MPITSKSSNKCLILISIILFALLLYYLSPILIPFLIAGILAYLCDPIVHQMMRFNISRTKAVIIVFLILFSVLTILAIVFVPLIQAQVVAFINQIPDMLSKIESKILPWIDDHFSIDLTNNLPKISDLKSGNIMQAGGSVLKTMLSSGVTLFETLLNLILIPVVTYYLLRDWDQIFQNIHNLIPRRIEPMVTQLSKESDLALSAFLRGQLLVMLVLSIYYAVVLTLMGLQFGMVIGMITGLISIVPYLGMIVGLTIAVITAAMQFGSLSSVLWVIVVFFIGHGLENAYLSPKLIGDRVGLHPIAVIFAILAGGQLFGFLGVLLALPVTAVLMVLLRHLLQQYHRSQLFKREKA